MALTVTSVVISVLSVFPGYSQTGGEVKGPSQVAAGGYECTRRVHPCGWMESKMEHLSALHHR